MHNLEPGTPAFRLRFPLWDRSGGGQFPAFPGEKACRRSRHLSQPSTIGDPMHPARIAELLEPFLGAPVPDEGHSEPGKAGEEPAVLSAAQLQSISTYIDILLRWTARINLTAIRDPDQIVTRHFGESLFAARHLFPLEAHVETAAPGCPAERSSAAHGRPIAGNRTSVSDVGSGAGFPGVDIKLWAPHISLTLIESNQKKVAFLREVARTLILTDIDIRNSRAEELTGATFNLVTLRAVE